MQVGDKVMTERGMATIVYRWQNSDPWDRDVWWVVQLEDDPTHRFLARHDQLSPPQLEMDVGAA